MTTKRSLRPDARPIRAVENSEEPIGRVGALRRLLRRFDEAASAYSAEGTIDSKTNRDAGSPKLWAVTLVVDGLCEFLDTVDYGPGRDTRRQPVSSLYKALSDWVFGREPPDWFGPRRPKYYGGGGHELWHGRALAAATLRRLKELGVPEKDAVDAVFKVVNGRGLGERGRATVGRWLRAFDPRAREKDRAPAAAAGVYSQIVDNLDEFIPSVSDAPRVTRLYQAWLTKELNYRGFYLRKPAPPFRKKGRA